MDLLVATQARLHRSSGTVRSETGARSYSFWARYLDAFDSVRVIARVSDGSERALGGPVEGPGVSVHAVPDFRSLREYLLRAHSVKNALKETCTDRSAALIARVPGLLGSIAIRQFKSVGAPYALEVVGDPAESLGKNSFRHPLRSPLRNVTVRRLRIQCREAAGVAYVTNKYLQSKYPPSPSALTASYSDADLPEEAYVSRPRHYETPPDPIRLVNVASMTHPYKGHDVLLEALAELVTRGRTVSLDLVGDGRLREPLERESKRLGLADSVSFIGQVEAGHHVQRILDSSDVFVLPSRTEGLPRALLEAMARGLPCAATNVGGVPDLLPAAELAVSGSASSMAQRIEETVATAERLTSNSARNLDKAREYSSAALQTRRQAFCKAFEAQFRHHIDSFNPERRK